MPYDKDRGFVSMNDALDAWKPFAVDLLMETAKHYNGFVTYKQLGSAVQDQSGIRHDGLLTNWIDHSSGKSDRSLCETAGSAAQRTVRQGRWNGW